MHRPTELAAILVALALTAGAPRAQDARPTAFTNARLLPIDGPPIERGTLVVRNGVIEALGADVAPPAGARIVDCAGGTIMPGLVSACSRAGLRPQPQAQPVEAGGRRRGGRGGGPPEGAPASEPAQNQAATKVVERLDPKQDVFGELLRCGITTLALTPAGDGLPGLGAVLRPDGRTLAELTADDDAFVFVGMARDTKVKKLLKEGFEQAAKVVAERKQPKPEPPKPAEPAKPAGDGKPPEPKPEPAPEPKPEPKPDPPPEPKPEAKPDEKPAEKKPEAPKPKDPNLEVLADLLEGKRRAILQIGSAADLLHWVHACGEGLAFPRAVAVPGYDTQAGTLDMALDSLQKLKASVLLPPQLSTRPRSRYLIHPARILHEAGIEVGFRLAEEQQGARQTFFQLMELVRTGLPADVALRGVTLVPAKALGVDAEVGSLAVGKRADLLWFSGDPLDPVSELRSVWLRGQQVPERAP